MLGAPSTGEFGVVYSKDPAWRDVSQEMTAIYLHNRDLTRVVFPDDNKPTVFKCLPLSRKYKHLGGLLDSEQPLSAAWEIFRRFVTGVENFDLKGKRFFDDSGGNTVVNPELEDSFGDDVILEIARVIAEKRNSSSVPFSMPGSSSVSDLLRLRFHHANIADTKTAKKEKSKGKRSGKGQKTQTQ
jgi:hypothetical protein